MRDTAPSEKSGDGGLQSGVLLDAPFLWNGVATSSSPFQSLSEGDEDIVAPNR